MAYLHDTDGQLLGEYDATGQPVKEYVHLEGEPIAQVDNTSITYLHTDHLDAQRKIKRPSRIICFEITGARYTLSYSFFLRHPAGLICI